LIKVIPTLEALLTKFKVEGLQKRKCTLILI
jgi:hypothetical protein